MKYCFLIALMSACLYDSVSKAMSSYDDLLESYCNYYCKNCNNKLNVVEYKKHVEQQSRLGGRAYYLLNTRKVKDLEFTTSHKRLSTLCKIIYFFYREGLKHNDDPQKNGLYIVDFHIDDSNKLLYEELIEKYLEKNSKDKTLVAKYTTTLWEKNKEVKFYQFFVKNKFDHKPTLPWGHSYIRVSYDSKNKKIHIRTTKDDCCSTLLSTKNYFVDRVFHDSRNEPGYKKIHLLTTIDEQFLNMYPEYDTSKKETSLLSFLISEKPYSGFPLSKIVTIVDKEKTDNEYDTERKEFLDTINKKYRYPKKMYGNEVYIHFGDLFELVAYLDYLTIVNQKDEKRDEIKDVAPIIEPFLTLDRLIFEYNNFKKCILKEKKEEKDVFTVIKETEGLCNFVKDYVLPMKNKISKLLKPHQEYLLKVIDILELILKTKTPGKHLLHLHMFNAEEHGGILKNLSEEIKSKKKVNSLYPNLPKHNEGELHVIKDDDLNEIKQELNNEYNATTGKLNSNEYTKNNEEEFDKSVDINITNKKILNDDENSNEHDVESNTVDDYNFKSDNEDN